VRRGDFKRVLRDEARAGARYDLVLLDPPYAVAEGYAAALGELVPAVLAPAALIVIESARGLDLALDLPADPPRRYGASTTQIIRNAP
jgi:16S rRNA G966 N2-methylase RsmD